MQYSIVNKKNLDSFAFRIDAEYYHPLYLEEDLKIRSHKNIVLGNIAFITDGQHGYFEIDDNSDIVQLTAKNSKYWFADKIDADKIAKSVDDNNKRSSLQENDLILTTRGTVGLCSIIKDEVLPANIDQDVARIHINSNDEILHEYLLTYLNSKFGYDWIKRNSSGMVQQGLALVKLRRMVIPNLQFSFQQRIKLIIDSAYNALLSSKKLFKESVNVLLEEIKLSSWEPQHQLSFVRNFSDTQQAERIDAEYYQPKYDDIIDAVKSYKGGYFFLTDIIDSYSSGFPFKSDSYVIDGVYLIRINNILNGHLELSNAVMVPKNDIQLSPNDLAKENDILISMSGTIGNSCKIPVGVTALINQRIFKFTPKNYDANLLPLILNSVVGYQQLNRVGTGGVQTNISGNDIKNIMIPIFSKDIQDKIIQRILTASENRLKSKLLIEVSKKAVELAVEEDENSAMDFIRNKLDSLNINIE